MKNTFLLLAFGLFASTAFAQADTAAISIIPQPTKLVRYPDTFVLPKTLSILAPDADKMQSASDFLKQKLGTATGYPVKVVHSGTTPAIKLSFTKTPDAIIGDEGYYLMVKPKSILIVANKPAGLFYGAQSLVQLFPTQIESKTVVKNVKWVAPSVTITDHPRFGWRGLMLDVSRHFFSKEDVKAYIDQMARYKFNLFHWHLTDDEGWRIEIKSRPNLTKKGAYNVQRVGKFGTFSPIRTGFIGLYG